jgi:oligopeptide/dipeptide ABC transporter ATP-binding protein
VRRQMTEVLVTHKGMSEAAATEAAIAMLDRVQIPDARRRIALYPHEFSGGMRQRAMIAMALLCEPELLIADEPTTALDVTVQRQILSLLRRLADERGMGLVIVSHDLAVVAQLADSIAVMYAGRVVEDAPTTQIFSNAQHPYTRALIASVPRLADTARGPLPTIAGSVESGRLTAACKFHPRCPYAEDVCRQERPPLERASANGAAVACWVRPWSGEERQP